MLRAGVFLLLAIPATVSACAVDDRQFAVAFDGGNDSDQATAATSTAIQLGTFEDDTALPEDPRFQNYQYYSYNPDSENLPQGAYVNSPLVAPGFNSNYALRLNWEVIDVPDGQLNYPGVGMRTLVTGSIDLSKYDRVVFAHVYQHQGPCQALDTVNVSIGCDELNTSFGASFAVSETWLTTAVRFDAMEEPSYLAPSGHTVQECLLLANSVYFAAQAELDDGECASGSLTFDNIEIRGAP